MFVTKKFKKERREFTRRQGLVDQLVPTPEIVLGAISPEGDKP